ncbi:ClpP/crotonase-like domain-containing protein [Multifurca ochricompacta]|uniref:ClpP/crotonase-like domain-containing protein n=1 Tax=Multifurca ochricompacta TaxID=376703 RepID=A0AAD4LVN4_9AGAM|nr:ClpP/crotonase-like domain-containing protein [Multifurca ochricompacta]
MSSSSTFPLQLPVGSQTPFLTLTRPSPIIWQIELHNGVDNRLVRALINDAFKPALQIVEREWRKERAEGKAKKDKNAGAAALIIVGRLDQEKFFSNGFDFPDIKDDTSWFPASFDPLLLDLLTFPIPTVAAINGHCFAGAAIITLACDYRVMTDGAKRNAWLCMNEVDFGAAWAVSFAALVRAKVSGLVARKFALEGHRFTPPEARDAGLVDEIVPGGTQGVLKRAQEIAQENAPKAREGVWGVIKVELYRPLIELVRLGMPTISVVGYESAAKVRLAKL